MQVSRDSIIVERQAGQVIVAPGVEATVKIQGGHTSGAFSVTEQVFQPGFFVPPHKHERIDEVSYLLEGVLGVMVGEKEFEAGTGSFVIRPKGVPHALWNVGKRPARFLDIYTPAGHEGFFEEMAKLRSAPIPPSPDQIFEAARRLDTIFLPELAPPLMQKYALKMPG